MKHKLLQSLMLIAALLTGTHTHAYDFTSDGIYYTIKSSTYNTIEVTYRYINYGSYSGDITIPETIIYNDILYRVTCIGSNAFSVCTSLTSVTIPNSVTSIGDGAFSVCTGLTSITIPNSVTSIGSDAFRDCSSLTSIIIPNSVTSIGESAFHGCSSLTSVIFNAENCVTMGSDYYPVFRNCTKLSSVTIGENVKNIPSYAFRGCTGLTSVNISDLEAWCKINFAEVNSNPLFFAKNLYLNGELLTELVIPDSIKEIKNHAFSGCSSLTNVIIPNSVTSIGRSAFEGCSGLTKVIIGSSVKTIENCAFANIERLGKIYLLNPTPPTCASVDIFNKVNKDKCTLYVPLGSAEAYKTTYVWWDFNNIIEKEMSGVEETLIDRCEDEHAVYYNLQGVRVENPSNGLYIKKQGNKVTKVVL